MNICFMYGYKRYNHYKSEDKGLISVDRSNKATLLLTIPRPVFKSYAKDLPPQTFVIDFNRLALSCRSVIIGLGLKKL